MRSFLSDVHLELKKVAWPSKPEVFGSTRVVIFLVVILVIFIFVMDTIVNKFLGFIIY